MEKGGYKIIDLKDANITTTGQTIKGIYNELAKNARKVILLSGITINNVAFSDEFVKVVAVGTDYILNAYAVVADNVLTKYDIFVEDDDTVTLQLKTVTGQTAPATGQIYFTVKEGT